MNTFQSYIFTLILTVFLVSEVQARDMFKMLGDAPVGRKFRPVEAQSPIPFDKRFHQLTEKQMRIYRADFPELEKEDTPPFPEKGMRAIYKPIIKGHERLARGGTLLLVAQINEEGGVDEVAIYESPMKEISELAMSVLFTTKFKPATCAGEPCKMAFPFEFKLRHRAKGTKTLHKEDFG